MIKKLLLIGFSLFILGITYGQRPLKNKILNKGKNISNIEWNIGSKVIHCSNFKKTIPVRDMPQVTEMRLPDDYLFMQEPDKRDMPVQEFEFSFEKDGPKYGNEPDIIQKFHGKSESKAPLQNWDGYVNAGGRPNDPTGAAGSNYYIQATNGDKYVIYDKTGNLEHTGTISDFWNPDYGGDGDPIVLYDKDASRWFIGQFGGSGDNGLYIAISATSDPLGSWYAYTFSSSDFPDYEKFSAWHDGYYMTANYSQKIFAFNRTKMLAGDPSAEAVYQTFSPPQSGFFVPMPADASDGTMPTTGPCPVFCYQDNGWSGVSTDAINIYNAEVNWSTLNMTVTQAASIPTSSFDASYDSGWDDVAQPGTSQKLDGIGGAMGFRAQFKPWSGYNTVVMTWAVQVTSSQRGIFWCELRQDQSTENWSLYQEGIYAPGTDNVWLGSIAMNDAGHIALAYAKTNTSNNTYMSLAYTGRLSCDPLGTLPIAEVVAQTGSGYQYGGINRVGDYAHTALDPDGVTFWHTNEYMFKNGQWDAAKTRIFSFQLPGSCAPPTISGVSPTNLYKDRGKEITITGSDLSGATFEIGGITGVVTSNDGSTAIVNFPAGNYTDGTLTASNSSGSDNSSITINTRTTIPVDASTGSNTDYHQTIDAAVDGLYSWIGSSSFSTPYIIEVAGGIYSETVTLNSNLNPTSSNNLTIQNASGASPVIDATGNDYGFDLGTVDYITLNGFTVHSSNLDGIYAQGNDLSINLNQIYGSTGGSGIKIETGNNCSIDNNLCYDNSRYGIHLNSNSHSIKNNTCYGNGSSITASEEVIFSEGFESGSLPGSWTQYGTGPNNWSVGYFTGPVAGPDGSTYYAVHNWNASYINRSLETTEVDLNGYSTATLEYYIYNRGNWGEVIYVEISTNSDGSGGGTWTELTSHVNDASNSFGGWSSLLSQDISAYVGNTINIRFRYEGTDGNSGAVDAVAIKAAPPSFNAGAGLYVESGTGVNTENNIFYAKSGDDNYYALKSENGITITSDYNIYYTSNTNLFDYNGTIGNTGPMGSNDLTSDPLFVNAGTDFHIQSVNGSYAGGDWPPTALSGGNWTNDASTSPALDAGNPADSYTNEPSGGSAINMGAYGNTVQASKSESTYVWQGDDITSPTDWNTEENWSSNTIPGAANDITIPASCPTYPSISGAAACRNLTIESGGSLTLTSGSLSLSGNWTNNGTFNAGSGTINFSGSEDQSIGGTQTNSFYNLTINNDNNLVISQNITVTNSLTLTSGSLNITDKNVNLGTSGSISGESNTNMIHGTTGTIIANDRVGELGLGNDIAGLGIEIASGSISDIDIIRGVQVQSGAASSSSLRKYFDISATPNSGLNASMVMQYYDHEFDADNGGTDEKTFVFYRSTDGGATWTEKYEATVDVDLNTMTIGGIDAFSRWTVSSKTEQVLPVEWNNYSASCEANSISINWSTLTEKNNDYFTIEKLTTNGNYTEIGRIEGAGNSNEINTYYYTDLYPSSGISYFRIKQTDYDGNYSYSPIFSANCNEMMIDPSINIFPNPFTNKISIYVTRNYLDIVNIEIFDSKGVCVTKNRFELSGGNSIGLTVNTSELDNGIYLVRVSGEDYSETKRLIKQ